MGGLIFLILFLFIGGCALLVYWFIDILKGIDKYYPKWIGILAASVYGVIIIALILKELVFA